MTNKRNDEGKSRFPSGMTNIKQAKAKATAKAKERATAVSEFRSIG
jgi:hypothetical protein